MFDISTVNVNYMPLEIKSKFIIHPTSKFGNVKNMLSVTGKVPEEQQKAEEMQMFTELYHEWKGVKNNHPHVKLPRLYDKVSGLVIVKSGLGEN